MTNYSVKNVDEYISASPEVSHSHLKEIRAAVKSAVPEAEEGISYGKPYYKYLGMLGGFDVYKKHIGFEIWSDALKDEDRKALEEKGYKTGSRTFQIGFDQKVPTEIIKKMFKEQAKFNEIKANEKE